MGRRKMKRNSTEGGGVGLGKKVGMGKCEPCYYVPCTWLFLSLFIALLTWFMIDRTISLFINRVHCPSLILIWSCYGNMASIHEQESDQSKRETMAKAKPHTIFAYGTLKRGFPNHGLMEDLMSKDDAVLLGTHCYTEESYPLVCGPHGIPYLINLPGSGHKVKGEVYVASDEAVDRLDEFEGVSGGHYERIPVVAVTEEGERVKAEAYMGHSRFGEVLWKMKGEVGLSEYGEKEAMEYVRKEDRAAGGGGRNTILHILR